MPTILIEQPQQQPSPYTYTLSGAQTVKTESAVARFDGTNASGDFLARLSFLGQDGRQF